MKWVTRRRPKTDRIACPWLIRRFIDPEAEILYVPPEQILEEAKREGARSFDAEGAEFTHQGSKSTFEVLMDQFGLGGDSALARLARTVHAADIQGELHTDPLAPGLLSHRRGLPRRQARRPAAPGPGVLRLRRAVRLVPTEYPVSVLGLGGRIRAVTPRWSKGIRPWAGWSGSPREARTCGSCKSAVAVTDSHRRQAPPYLGKGGLEHAQYLSIVRGRVGGPSSTNCHQDWRLRSWPAAHSSTGP